jgi:hypothetical protein
VPDSPLDPSQHSNPKPLVQRIARAHAYARPPPAPTNADPRPESHGRPWTDTAQKEMPAPSSGATPSPASRPALFTSDEGLMLQALYSCGAGIRGWPW